jgi:hypothetical protein
MEMLGRRSAAVLIGIAAVVAGAVALAGSSADTNVSIVPKIQRFAAVCPKIEWPYGCDWRAVSDSKNKHFSERETKRTRLYMSVFSKRVRRLVLEP